MNGLLSGFLQRKRFKAAEPYLSSNAYLDLGCYKGELRELIPASSTYTGIDFDPVFVSECKRKYPKDNFYVCDINTTSINSVLNSSDKFDTITALAVVEHLDHPEKLLTDLKEHLNESGKIIITVPSGKADPILHLGAKFRIFSNKLDEHKQQFTDELIHELAERAGYKIIKHSTFELGLNHLIVLAK